MLKVLYYGKYFTLHYREEQVDFLSCSPYPELLKKQVSALSTGFPCLWNNAAAPKILVFCHDSTFIWRDLEHKQIWKEKILNVKQRYMVNYHQ